MVCEEVPRHGITPWVLKNMLLRAGHEHSERVWPRGVVCSPRETEPDLKARNTFDVFLTRVCGEGGGGRT